MKEKLMHFFANLQSLNSNISPLHLPCVALNLTVRLAFYTALQTMLILSSLVSPLFFPARLRRRPLKGQRSRGSVSEGRVRAVHDPGIIREVMALVLRRRGVGRGPWRTRPPPPPHPRFGLPCYFHCNGLSWLKRLGLHWPKFHIFTSEDP